MYKTVVNLRFINLIVKNLATLSDKNFHFVKDRRVPYNIPPDWRALWYSNLDELQRVNEANDNNTVSNVTVQLGGTAFLHCKVRNIGERSISDAEVFIFIYTLIYFLKTTSVI